MFEGKKFFNFPKPIGLIKRAIEMGTTNDDIILDFFSGSGTTAHAVAQLNAEDGGNRRWICVQLPELTDEKSEAYKAGYHTIADIARERIRRAGAKIRADQADRLASRNAPLDLGFRAYRVGDSNFKQWNELVSDPEEIRQQALANLDPLEEGTTDDDLLIELLLKRGISPLAKIEQYDSFCFIPPEKLVICLAYSMTEELFTAILATKPSSIIILDRAFGDDINLKVNLLLQAERQGVEVEVV
ncbi:DNA methyltransferase [Candidatus Nanosynbacter sp. TM7-087]|uniref:DNA methyltransferase n=1 Tax=Candidatus Nanosynbacter sp. TM7-087 TaxID=2902631 RepID=UPI002A4E13C4|nr:DNA methyltransferase [Candidatus Nanosynbacter sp. TM7-087]